MAHRAARSGDVDTIAGLIARGTVAQALVSPWYRLMSVGRSVTGLVMHQHDFESDRFANSHLSILQPTSLTATPLHMAVYGRSERIISMLVNAGASIDAFDEVDLRPRRSLPTCACHWTCASDLTPESLATG